MNFICSDSNQTLVKYWELWPWALPENDEYRPELWIIGVMDLLKIKTFISVHYLAHFTYQHPIQKRSEKPSGRKRESLMMNLLGYV